MKGQAAANYAVLVGDCCLLLKAGSHKNQYWLFNPTPDRTVARDDYSIAQT